MFQLTGQTLVAGGHPSSGDLGLWLVRGQMTYTQTFGGEVTDSALVGGRVEDVCASVDAD